MDRRRRVAAANMRYNNRMTGSFGAGSGSPRENNNLRNDSWAAEPPAIAARDETMLGFDLQNNNGRAHAGAGVNEGGQRVP